MAKFWPHFDVLPKVLTPPNFSKPFGHFGTIIERFLIKAFEDKIKDNANAIEILVKNTAPKIADALENCGDIVMYKAKITDILITSYLAFDLGCALDFS